MASSTSTVMNDISDNTKKHQIKQEDAEHYLKKVGDEALRHRKQRKKNKEKRLQKDIPNIPPEQLYKMMTPEQQHKCHSMYDEQLKNEYRRRIPNDKRINMTREQMVTSREVDECVLPILNHVVIKTNETTNGHTQKGEIVINDHIRDALIAEGFEFTKAGSQQPLDFRNVRQKGRGEEYAINIEVKRTKSPTIFCNDTIPAYNTKFLICYTGRKGSRVICCTGSELMGENGESTDANWEQRVEEIHVANQGILQLRQQYKNKEFIQDSPMRIFPRVNLSVKIHHLLN